MVGSGSAAMIYTQILIYNEWSEASITKKERKSRLSANDYQASQQTNLIYKQLLPDFLQILRHTSLKPVTKKERTDYKQLIIKLPRQTNLVYKQLLPD